MFLYLTVGLYNHSCGICIKAFMTVKRTMRQYGSCAILMISLAVKSYWNQRFTRFYSTCDITHAQLGRLQKYTERWSSENKCIYVLTKHLLSRESYKLTQAKVFEMRWKDRAKHWHARWQRASSSDALLSNHHRCSVANI